MRIAFIVFNDITLLDLIGVYDPLTRLQSMKYIPELRWDICAFTDIVKDSFGLEIHPSVVTQPLANYDAIIVPGGWGTRNLVADAAFIQWLKTASDVRYKISICTGSLLLGAAGFLEGKKATTNFNDYDNLRPYCKEVLTDRIVEDDHIITAGAVTASIDLGLYLCKKWAGNEAAQAIRRKMDYLG